MNQKTPKKRSSRECVCVCVRVRACASFVVSNGVSFLKAKQKPSHLCTQTWMRVGAKIAEDCQKAADSCGVFRHLWKWFFEDKFKVCVLLILFLCSGCQTWFCPGPLGGQAGFLSFFIWAQT